MNRTAFAPLKKDLSIAVLTYNRPEETETFLRNLRSHVKIENSEIIVSSNGGEQKWIIDLYKNNIFDKLILSKDNEGAGFGTMKLINYCISDFVLYIQPDHDICRDFTTQEFLKMKSLFESHSALGAIDFAGLGEFSERGFLMRTDFYNENPLQEGCGPGPYEHIGKWTEETTRTWIKQSDKNVFTWPYQLFINRGKYTERETPCGGRFKIRCDTQQVWVITNPKKKYVFPNFTDMEWENVIAGKWTPGNIPLNQQKHSFNCFGE